MAFVPVFAAGLIAVGLLRYCDPHSEGPRVLAARATLLYIALTVVAAFGKEVAFRIPLMRGIAHASNDMIGIKQGQLN